MSHAAPNTPSPRAKTIIPMFCFWVRGAGGLPWGIARSNHEAKAWCAARGSLTESGSGPTYQGDLGPATTRAWLSRGSGGEHVGPGLSRVLDRLVDTPAEVVSEIGETLRQMG